MKAVLGNGGLELLYDVVHNIAKVEEHQINGEKMKLIVHRKGATWAFPPEHPEIPDKYRQVGQLVLIPGSMGAASYISVGQKEGEESFFLTTYVAGRAMSRNAAMK